MRRFRFRTGIRFLGFAIIFVGLTGLAVMLLWNALLPTILGVSTISFGQAIGLLVLSRILFGGSRGWGGWRGGSNWRGGYGPFRGAWREKMNERWQQMTPEQREQMKQRWRDKCGGGSRKRGRWERGSEPEQPDQNGPTPTAV